MIYFDNSATTAIDSEALASYQAVSQQYFANPSSLHQLGDQASLLLKQSRQQVADLLEVNAEEIFFTSGGSESDNWAIKGTALEKKNTGKHLITSSIEHPAVLQSFKSLEDLGFEVTYLDVDEYGQVDLGQLKSSLRPDTTLVSIMAINNEVGAIQPLEEIGNLLEDYPAVHFHVDAVQALGRIPLDLASSRIDLATFSAHKFHGPRGVGILYKKKNRKIEPLIHGGGQESGERSGTENLAGIVAMAKAMRLQLDQLDQKNGLLAMMNQALRTALVNKKGIHIFSSPSAADHILCMGIEGIRGEVLVHALEEHDIFVSTTSACSSRAGSDSSTLLAMGIDHDLAQTAIRVSLSDKNQLDEVDQFLQQFLEIYDHFSKVLEK